MPGPRTYERSDDLVGAASEPKAWRSTGRAGGERAVEVLKQRGNQRRIAAEYVELLLRQRLELEEVVGPECRNATVDHEQLGVGHRTRTRVPTDRDVR